MVRYNFACIIAQKTLLCQRVHVHLEKSIFLHEIEAKRTLTMDFLIDYKMRPRCEIKKEKLTNKTNLEIRVTLRGSTRVQKSCDKIVQFAVTYKKKMLLLLFSLLKPTFNRSEKKALEGSAQRHLLF